jgi:hypothetical protein
MKSAGCERSLYTFTTTTTTHGVYNPDSLRLGRHACRHQALSGYYYCGNSVTLWYSYTIWYIDCGFFQQYFSYLTQQMHYVACQYHPYTNPYANILPICKHIALKWDASTHHTTHTPPIHHLPPPTHHLTPPTHHSCHHLYLPSCQARCLSTLVTALPFGKDTLEASDIAKYTTLIQICFPWVICLAD